MNPALAMPGIYADPHWDGDETWRYHEYGRSNGIWWAFSFSDERVFSDQDQRRGWSAW